MKKVTVRDLKARCLDVVNAVCGSGKPVLITEKGVPIAKLVPVMDPAFGVFGCMARTAAIRGDLEASVWPTPGRRGRRA